jgi:L-iditol 2-dehydrogenase
VEIIETRKPRIADGKVLVRTQLLSLCGSDVRRLYYPRPEEVPLPIGAPGHEMIGIVEEVDERRSSVKPGDPALVLAPFSENAMAEYFLAEQDNVLPLPDYRPLEHLLMAQQLGTVVFGTTRVPRMPGGDAVIIGQGSAGLFWSFMLRKSGLARVIALEKQPARLKAARDLGATHTVDVSRDDPVEAVTEITRGEMADLVVEACGEVEGINLAPRLVEVNGYLLYFGVPHAPRFEFDYLALFRKYCHATSSGGVYQEKGLPSFRKALELIAGGEVDVAPMITHRFPFERVAEAYDLARTRVEGVIKTVVEMPGYRSVGGSPRRAAPH